MGQVESAIGPTLPLVAFFGISLVRREVTVNFIAASPSLELTGVYFRH
jgi:hypothetical protein